ncbi:MAG: FAD-binding oxidoreductase [Gammaproteobacteria bacterium]|nr:FAD-binding oxidoreductase [Gammaproteobacteria bacterium]
MLIEKCRQLYQELSGFLPEARLIRDPLRTLAYGTDASFYRLIPKLVVKVENEAEVIRLLELSQRHGIPVTFRAAGTSLSGQAITDSVLAVLANGWDEIEINADASEIRLQPGVIGGLANSRLAPFNKKIGPDPASINAAKIGGIAANNASGMCCGTAQNSYRTLSGMRIIFADGAILDTRDQTSLDAFQTSHAELLSGIAGLAKKVQADTALREKIRHKYRLKNTTGYSLNALVDFEHPIDIIQHLMIGSEGTLGFIADITYRTVPDHPHKATAMILFPDIETACRAVAVLKGTPVDAVELMDRAALRSVENKPGLPGYLRELDGEVAALLVETRADAPERLAQQAAEVKDALAIMSTVQPIIFSHDAAECATLWNIRKGLFPAVGAVRETGTTVIIEDIAFPVPELAHAVRDLHALFLKYDYHEALIFGHALEGNLHFVFTQDFGTPSEVARYQGLMDAVCELVVNKYQGSLKAEHGTGRNMAPFVEMEWGRDAYELMHEIKQIFDPSGILNPGVLLNTNPHVHLENLKPLPAANPIVDKCIECGFCEAVCPSRNLTLTPRQRIVTRREMARLEACGDDPNRLAAFEREFQYQMLDSCAADGMCATRCPVTIDTGRLTKETRATQHAVKGQRIAHWLCRHFTAMTRLTRIGLSLADGAHALFGSRVLDTLAGGARRLSGGRLPQWNEYMPGPAAAVKPAPVIAGYAPKVVLFPSCASRTMGPARGDQERDSLHVKTLALLQKAGYQVIYPQAVDGLCCGMPFESKGFPQQAANGMEALEQALLIASREGEYPILCDTSPCTQRMREHLDQRLKVYEPVGFIQEFLRSRLVIHRRVGTIALHPTCSSRKMGLDGAMRNLAEACAEQVVVPEEIACCGFAGDRGFNFPELNASALQGLRQALPDDCEAGYSNSRTCEIGLSLHSGLHYRSIVYLVDRCSEPAR